MVSKKVKVVNSQGFHMRPAGLFTKTVSKFDSDVFLVVNGNEINAKSIMNVIGAGIKCGAEVEVKCSGNDEETALNTAVELIESGLGEE